MADSLLATPLPLEFRLQGDLAAWHPRLATFLPLQDYRMAGIADISGNGLFATSRMQLASLAGKVQPAQFVGNGLYLNEELLQFQGQADMQLSQQQLQVSNLVIQSATLAAQVTDGQLVWSKGLVAKGNARYEANLERLQRWFYNPQTPPGQLAGGMLSGNCTLATTGNLVQLQANNSVKNLVVYSTESLKAAIQARQTPQPIWSETELQVNARAQYDGDSDLAQCDVVEIISQALAMRAQGKLEQATGKVPQLVLAGKLDYDWAVLGPLLEPYTKVAQIKLVGRRSSNFQMSGPLTISADPKTALSTVSMNLTPAKPDSMAKLKDITAAMNLGWDKLQIMGIDLAQNELNLQLQNGIGDSVNRLSSIKIKVVSHLLRKYD